MREFSFREDTVDFLVYDYTLNYNEGKDESAYEDLDSSIKELARVLRPEGVALVGVLAEDHLDAPGDGIGGRRFAWSRYKQLFEKYKLQADILFAGEQPESERAVKEITEGHFVVFLRRTRASTAWGRIFREYFAPWGLLGGLDTMERIRSGQRILDVNTQHNDLAIAITDAAKRDPSKFGAFVIGTNRAMVTDTNDPNFRQFDVRHLDFPEGFEGFDTIVSDSGFPTDVLKWLDRGKKDSADIRDTYDFSKLIDTPISLDETIAQLEQGFSEMLRWLKLDGRVRLDPPATWDPETKSYKDLDVVEQALNNLKSRYHNQYPHLRYRVTDMGLLIAIDPPKD